MWIAVQVQLRFVAFTRPNLCSLDCLNNIHCLEFNLELKPKKTFKNPKNLIFFCKKTSFLQPWDESLFKTVLSDGVKNIVNRLLPENKTVPYNRSSRSHNLTLTYKLTFYDDRNLINRVIFGTAY